MTVRLNRDVEKLKIELSQQQRSERSLDYIESRLVAQATDAKLHKAAESFMRSFWGLLDRVSAQIKDYKPVLFLTGGMSQAPHVVAAVKQAFPRCQLAPADASLGVVDGLAVYASLTEEVFKTEPV